MGFQTTIPVEQAFGIAGALYSDAPVRAQLAELVSASDAYNIIGATAYTVTSPDLGTSGQSLVAAAGGTGAFAGILANSKVYATAGVSGSALNPSFSLPNHTIAELVLMGDLIVTIPGAANIGDRVAYDTTTGQLSTYPATTTFTGAMATNGILTVAAITAGELQVGSQINGTGIPQGIYVSALGTALGGTGTYTTNYVGAAITSEAMTSDGLPPTAAAFTANIAVVSTVPTMTVSAVASGRLPVGDVIHGAGVLPNTVITALGTGTGGTGTYILNQAQTVSSESMTSGSLARVPGALVYRFAAAGVGANAVIKLTN